jgi:hypothetical protein
MPLALVQRPRFAIVRLLVQRCFQSFLRVTPGNGAYCRRPTPTFTGARVRSRHYSAGEAPDDAVLGGLSRQAKSWEEIPSPNPIPLTDIRTIQVAGFRD